MLYILMECIIHVPTLHRASLTAMRTRDFSYFPKIVNKIVEIEISSFFRDLCISRRIVLLLILYYNIHLHSTESSVRMTSACSRV